MAPPKVGLIQRGPLVSVVFRLHPKHEELLLKAGGTPPTARGHLLVDTGATFTCVVDSIPSQLLGLTPTNFRPVVGVSQKPEERPVYLMAVEIGVEDTRTRENGSFLFQQSIVGMASPTQKNYDGLFGRDFLSHGELNYKGQTGVFDLLFEGTLRRSGATRNKAKRVRKTRRR